MAVVKARWCSQRRKHERRGFDLGSGRSPGEGNGNLLQYSTEQEPAPGKFLGQRSLVGHGPWGCKELETTEHTHTHTHTHTHLDLSYHDHASNYKNKRKMTLGP